MNPDQIRQLIRQELAFLVAIDRLTFRENIQIFDNRDIQVGRTTGTKIGTAADQKIGFYGVTPVVQAAAVTPAGGGVTIDADARRAISDLIAVVHNIGITA